MGFFSWETSDTHRSISNIYSCRSTFPVYMLFPNGKKLKETEYEGYGEFDGTDVYTELALWNDPEKCKKIKASAKDLREAEVTIRNLGIDMEFGDEPISYPLKFVEDDNLAYDDVPASKSDPCQGYFYPEADNDDDDYYD